MNVLDPWRGVRMGSFRTEREFSDIYVDHDYNPEVRTTTCLLGRDCNLYKCNVIFPPGHVARTTEVLFIWRSAAKNRSGLSGGKTFNNNN